MSKKINNEELKNVNGGASIKELKSYHCNTCKRDFTEDQVNINDSLEVLCPICGEVIGHVKGD